MQKRPKAKSKSNSLSLRTSSRWVVVTGASQGIGRAICEKLSHEGWSIVLVSRDINKLNKVAKSLKTETHCIAADLQSESSIRELVLELKKKLTKCGLKALVNNAGIYQPMSFSDSTDESWETQLAVNLMGPVRICRALYPLLKKTKPSAIINISSTLALRPIANSSAYSASKAALNNFTMALALEWAPDIRVNCICPGIIDTPIQGFHSLGEKSEVKKHAQKMQPMGRVGKPSDIAAAVSFLLSEESSWTTGSAWTIDGGIQLK